MKLRRMTPMARPVATSRMIHPTMPPIVGGRAGRVPATSGHMTSDSNKASDRRTRGGT
ncbi:hypothetical protein D3C80_2072040 [compost metagenome]